MKALFFSLTLLLSTSLCAQTIDQIKKENEKLKKENEILLNNNNYLTKKLAYHDTLATTTNEVKSFDSSIEIKVLSCTGNKSRQEVTLELVYINKSTNKDLTHYYLNNNLQFAIDGMGQKYKVAVPLEEIPLLTEIETRVKYTIPNIMPGTDSFSVISLLCNSKKGLMLDGHTSTEIRNVKITWTN